MDQSTIIELEFTHANHWVDNNFDSTIYLENLKTEIGN